MNHRIAVLQCVAVNDSDFGTEFLCHSFGSRLQIRRAHIGSGRVDKVADQRCCLSQTDRFVNSLHVLDKQDTRPGAAIQIAITRSEENTSELQSLMRRSYAVYCL